MIGVLFTFMFQIVLNHNPYAITFPDNTTPKIETIIYFSFTTLTTLGYGDILPNSPSARTVAILEAITGVLYIAILVARLLGIFVNNTNDTPKEKK
jgi:hypothetical protein